MRFTIIFTVLMLSVTFFIGCGGNSQNPHGTVHVEGTVTFDGAPIEGVNVTLAPREGDQSAGGITDDKGKFTVITSGFAGAKPGSYDVTFVKMESLPNLSFEESMEKYGGDPPKPKRMIPQKYETPKTSGIEPITVETDRKKNVFTFELTSQ